jgi:hypothetical protein
MKLIFFWNSSQFAKKLRELKIRSFSEKSVETPKSGVFVYCWWGYFENFEDLIPEYTS